MKQQQSTSRNKMYKYSERRPSIFTDEGQKLFLRIRDKTRQLLKLSGAVRCGEMIAGNSGDTWNMMACIDRMVELGEIREITSSNVAGQDRIFVRVEHDD